MIERGSGRSIFSIPRVRRAGRVVERSNEAKRTRRTNLEVTSPPFQIPSELMATGPIENRLSPPEDMACTAKMKMKNNNIGRRELR
jgi:hypothetical protein